MTFEDKKFLHDRISAAIQSLDADYSFVQNQAAFYREYYYQMRERAQNYHEQRMILLQAQQYLWNDEEDF